MPIEHLTSGGTVITGDSISYFRLCVLKSAVWLELQGIKPRRGRVIWKQAARELQLPRPWNKQKVHDALVARIAELRPQQEHVVEDGGRTRREVAGAEVQ